MSSEWLTGTLGEYIELSNGKTRPEEGGRTSVYGSNGIIGSCQESNSPKETIVIGRVGTYCGSLHFSKEECWVTDNAIKAVAKKDGNSRYFYELLNPSTFPSIQRPKDRYGWFHQSFRPILLP